MAARDERKGGGAGGGGAARQRAHAPAREGIPLRCEELRVGQVREALSFLERDPVRNLRPLWALRRWGPFNLGLAEQGGYLAAWDGGGMRGLLFLNNQGMMRIAARGGVAVALVGQALSSWGVPRVLAGPEEEVEEVLGAVRELAKAVEHREEEVSMALSAEDFVPRGGGAEPACEDDLEQLVDLERMLHRDLLGSCPQAWAVRLQMRRSLEGGAAAVVRHGGKAVAKAEIEAATPRADELGGVYTMPEHRRRGHAAAACSLLCGASLERGRAVRLETQRDNTAALSLYRELGFKVLWPHLAVRFRR